MHSMQSGRMILQVISYNLIRIANRIIRPYSRMELHISELKFQTFLYQTKKRMSCWPSKTVVLLLYSSITNTRDALVEMQ